MKWWVPGLGLLVTATLVTAGFGWTIDRAVEHRARVALDGAGMGEVTADASYRSITLTGPSEHSGEASLLVWEDRLVTNLVYLSTAAPTPGPSPQPTPSATSEPSPSPSPPATAEPSPSPSGPVETIEAVLPEPQTVTFAVDSADLNASSLASLDTLATVMVAALEIDPTLRLSIAGHTDSVRSAAYNQTLSEARAASVRDYLISKGVAPDALVAVGYGETQPVATNDTEAGRAANRRVDITILAED